MSRASTRKALEGFFKKASKVKRRRKNASPEKSLTAHECLLWLELSGFLMSTVEAKAVWSVAAGCYLKGQVKKGFSDAVGCCPDGTAAFIEFTAPGKRSTLKPHQRDFLLKRIEVGAFAVCVDSLDMLKLQWVSFQGMRLEGHSREYLRQALPKRRQGTSLGSDEQDELF